MQQDIQKADIERYALGLTSPLEAARIERAMEERPELRQLVEDVQRDLHEYAERIDIPPVRPGNVPSSDRFSRLDEEMLEIISRQNDRLRRWIALVGVLLLLAAAGGVYLFYQNGRLTTQFKSDRAILQQELNYAHTHLHQAERRMDAWEAGAHFVKRLSIENVDGASVGLYTFETGAKVLLNVAGLPADIETLAVWDERKPRHVIHHLRPNREDNLHYINLDSRDQVKWLKISAVPRS